MYQQEHFCFQCEIELHTDGEEVHYWCASCSMMYIIDEYGYLLAIGYGGEE